VSVQYLTPDQIIALWRQEVGADTGKYYVRDAGLVASSAARPGPVFGTEPYETLTDKAAALLHSLVCNHAFSDGNKRAALIATDVFLQLNGAYLDAADEDAIFTIVLGIATHDLDDVPAIAERLSPLIRPVYPEPA
jgi:death on curing protein